jgi:hypothetical protein
MRAFGRDRFAEGIMASGRARRVNRSNTWPHRPAQHQIVKNTLANKAPSTHGTNAKCDDVRFEGRY